MEKNNKPIATILALYFVCAAVKYIEFLYIRTDQTFIADNILCKLFIIAIVAVALSRKKWKWSDIGFKRDGLLKGLCYGFALGIVTFALSYLAEFIILWSMGKHPSLGFFITNFAISGQNVTGLSLAAVVICVIGNIVNVWAEEGLFRGYFLKLGNERLSFKRANFFQAFLFGIWHIVTVVVWVVDGSMSIPVALFMSIGYIALALILGYEWGLCTALTGTIWTGVFEHFFNNFISNSLHTVTETGIDEMQIIRIVISNILSLLIVLAVARHSKKRKAQAA
ncbi:MAG: type II CAAX endopeptidase family protein [Oscillospiraceae bacterium]